MTRENKPLQPAAGHSSVEPVLGEPPVRMPPPLGEPVAEFGGVEGPDPTRFGDWEKGGRCIDF